MKNIAVIILLAGYSSRMKSGHKALLPFANGKNILEYSIDIFKQAGINKIFLVLGHEEERIQEIIKDSDILKNCTILINSNFKQGMFSSIYTGISSIIYDEKIEATFLMPVDATLIKKSTIENILKYWLNSKEKEDFSILIPSFLDKCGHPLYLFKSKLKLVRFMG